MKNARRSRRVPSSDLLDVRQSTNSQKCSTTLLMQSMMHALPLAYITDIPSHITCATPACVHASPDRQKQEATRLSPGVKERLIVKISYLMSFTRLLSRKPRTMLSPKPAFLTKSFNTNPCFQRRGKPLCKLAWAELQALFEEFCQLAR